MKVQSINLNSIYYKTQKQTEENQISLRSFSTYSNIPFCSNGYKFWEIKSKMDEEKKFCKSFTEENGKVTSDQLSDAINNHPFAIMACSNICERLIREKELCITPELCAKFALELKKYYDEMYENYTIISIGTSPSPITEVMNLLGSNVIFLPISGLRDFEDVTIPFFKKQFPTISSKHPRIKCLMQYAAKKGIKNAKEPLVVLDYTSSGKSLRAVCKILEEKGDINPQKIKPHSLNEDIKTISKQKGTISEREIYFLLEDLTFSRLENISNTPHFQYNNLYDDEYCKKSKYEIFKMFDDFSQKEARAWILCAAYEAKKINRWRT